MKIFYPYQSNFSLTSILWFLTSWLSTPLLSVSESEPDYAKYRNTFLKVLEIV